MTKKSLLDVWRESNEPSFPKWLDTEAGKKALEDHENQLELQFEE